MHPCALPCGPKCQSSSSVSVNNEGVAGVLCQAESGGFWCVVGDPFKGAVESGGHPTGKHDSEMSLQASVQVEVGVPGCPCSRDLGLVQLLGIITVSSGHCELGLDDVTDGTCVLSAACFHGREGMSCVSPPLPHSHSQPVDITKILPLFQGGQGSDHGHMTSFSQGL